MHDMLLDNITVAHKYVCAHTHLETSTHAQQQRVRTCLYFYLYSLCYDIYFRMIYTCIYYRTCKVFLNQIKNVNRLTSKNNRHVDHFTGLTHASPRFRGPRKINARSCPLFSFQFLATFF